MDKKDGFSYLWLDAEAYKARIKRCIILDKIIAAGGRIDEEVLTIP